MQSYSAVTLTVLKCFIMFYVGLVNIVDDIDQKFSGLVV